MIESVYHNLVKQLPYYDPEYNLSVVTPASQEPVTYQELSDHLRLDQTVDQTLVTALGIAARRYVETVTKLVMEPTTFQVQYDSFAYGSNGGAGIYGYGFGAGVYGYGYGLDGYRNGGRYGLRLPRRPVTSVTNVSYVDSTGTTQTLASDQYQVDYKGVWTYLRPKAGTAFPLTQVDKPNAVTIQFVAGLAAADELAKLCIKELVGHWYENREAIVVGKTATSLPASLDAALWLLAAPGV